ncbi:hypothetical protein CYMTET_53363 [Cymbomonas tetramitiformis]|uniref:Uncharacterized protein n=1 Tax=Cymbomonas tetramitiformis TaxID=36881 RepID=A0AAE0BIX2_9CHLO|nr:hypothetical protein CYMTET_53363 [Cymbomonas tetramitiformis]
MDGEPEDEMEVVDVVVQAAEDGSGEKHGKEAVSGENVAESEHDKKRATTPEFDAFKDWLCPNDDTAGQERSNDDTAGPERVVVDVRTLFKPAESAEKGKQEAKLEEEAKQVADEHESAKKTVKKLTKVMKQFVNKNIQEMSAEDATGAAVRAELKRKQDEIDVLTTERKKQKERRQTLEASLAEVSQKLEMNTPTKATGLPELPSVMTPIPEVPEASSRQATPAPKEPPAVPNQPGFFYGGPWDPVKCYEGVCADGNLDFKTEKKMTLRDGSIWDARKSGINEIEFLEFLVANPLEGKPIGFSRSDIYVTCQDKTSKVLRNVWYKATVVAIGAEQKKCWVFQSDVLTYSGVPAVTLACCDSVKAIKQLLSVFFEGVGQKEALLRNLLVSVKETIRVKYGQEVAPDDDDEEVQEELAKIDDLLDDEFTRMNKAFKQVVSSSTVKHDCKLAGCLAFKQDKCESVETSLQ